MRGYGDAVAEPPWLDEREQRAWRGFLQLYAQVTSRLRRQMHRDSGLSYSDYEVLAHLSEAPEGCLRPFQLAEALQWEKSRLSHQLRRMGERGLVARRGCPTDARGMFFEITPTGRGAIEEAAPLHVREVRRVFIDVLTPAQLDALADIAETVLRHLGDTTGSPGPTGTRPAAGPEDDCPPGE